MRTKQFIGLSCYFAAGALTVSTLCSQAPPESAVGYPGLLQRESEALKRFAPLPYPPFGTFGQALVDMTMVKHPELKEMSIHITPIELPPHSYTQRRIMCSSFGNIGRPDTQEEYDTFLELSGKAERIESGKVKTFLRKESSPAVCEVMMPLSNNSLTRKAIGLLVLGFSYKEGDSIDRFVTIAQEIGNDLRVRITDKNALLKPAL